MFVSNINKEISVTTLPQDWAGGGGLSVAGLGPFLYYLSCIFQADDTNLSYSLRFGRLSSLYICCRA
jgi:hypothetical protein